MATPASLALSLPSSTRNILLSYSLFSLMWLTASFSTRPISKQPIFMNEDVDCAKSCISQQGIGDIPLFTLLQKSLVIGKNTFFVA